uniref:Uncharacterized protein n=1 Tax=Rhizophora mucronata TaxID=61149 RepID=A0A2P2N6N1_RHIMU
MSLLLRVISLRPILIVFPRAALWGCKNFAVV